MKKFLTLALALVMALALAAPAMAFVDFEYTADSKYDLDAYLVDYETGYKVFSSTGVWTELPAADRGYVTNEMVGAVVEVLIPAQNAGDDVMLTVEGSKVNLQSYVNTAVNSADTNQKLTQGTKSAAEVLAGASNVYYWSWNPRYEWIELNPPTDVKIMSTVHRKDFTAAWLVFGRVTGDDAYLTVKLSNATNNYNDELEKPAVGASDTAKFKIGDNKYIVTLTSYADASDPTKVDRYVYTIAPDGSGTGRVYIYADSNFKTKAMVATGGGYGVQMVADGKAVYEVDFGTNGQNWKSGASISVNGKTAITHGASPLDAIGGIDDAVIAQDSTLFAASGTSAAWLVTGTTNGIKFEAVNAGIEGKTAGAPAALDIEVTAADDSSPITVTHTDGTEIPKAETNIAYYLVHTNGKLYKALYADPANPDLTKMPPETETEPAGVTVGFLNDVLADFNMNPALVNNVLKPEYLGQYRSGNTIETIVLDIQPWQAYVSIPDIEVIDPPKTGDAATLAGFVMIVLAAAGVVVFKKVRA